MYPAMRLLVGVLGFVCVVFGSVGSMRADTVTLTPVKDNTLCQDAAGALSNGAAEHLRVGRTCASAGSQRRRALVEFDLGSLPSGAVVTAATLKLYVDRESMNDPPGAETIQVHRVTNPWGEGDSSGSGACAPRAIADATWLHSTWYPTPFDPVFWDTPGGDFVAGPSASTSVAGTGLHSWSSVEMVDDVNSWLADPGTNHGWILIGVESASCTAKRLTSREATGFEPELELTYDVGDGESFFFDIRKVGPELEIAWDWSCFRLEPDYAIYQGDLGAWEEHTPITCSTDGNRRIRIVPTSGNHYFLVVPRHANYQGCFGFRGDGTPRTSGVEPCIADRCVVCPN